ncbi:MAG: hypothetical protein ABIO92_01020 [Chloroflexia bacterium]
MLDEKVKILSETLARGINRRKFLKQTGGTIFAGMTALAAGHVLGGNASAAERQPAYTLPQCAPPGPYCNLNGVNEPNGCRGGSCYQHLALGQVMQCRVYYQYYQAGCWTTNVSGGYWVCCDCECFDSSGGNRRTCGCAQFSTQPGPRPDSPGGISDS